MTATLQTTNIQNAASSTTNLALDTSGNVTVGSSLTAANNITATSGTMVMASSFLRNRIINGYFAIDQRNAGASQTFSAGNSGYTVDRWFVGYAAGGSVTTQRVSGPSVYSYAIQVAPQSGSTQVNYQQRIESLNCQDLTVGTNITISGLAYVDSTANGTFNVNLGFPSGADNYASETFATAQTITLAAGTYTYFSKTFTLSTTGTNGLDVILGFISAAGRTFKITGVQLEVGSVATPFERRLYGQELVLCQRYCYVCTIRPLGITLNGNALYSGILSYPVTMRASPTLSNASCTVSSGSVGTPILQTSSGQASTLDAAIIYNSANNWTANQAIAITGTFSAEL